jgi:uncharacterized protein YqjF (DUF2071 family)
MGKIAILCGVPIGEVLPMGKELFVDRLAYRARPPGTPVMHQRWEDLLFLHWPMDPVLLRPKIPDSLEIETFDGKAWVGITPFHLENVRGANLPTLPGLSSFHELNVRTYVTHKGIPGIWFLSLDASKLVPVAAARVFFMLPYCKARIRMVQRRETFYFELKRSGSPEAEFIANWQLGQPLRDPDQDSLAFFLVERYYAFTVENGTIYHIRIYHHPWMLEDATVHVEHSRMFSALGLPEPEAPPLVHYSRSQEVEIWPPVPADVRLDESAAAGESARESAIRSQEK